MDAVLIVFGGFVLFMVLFVVALGVWHPRTGRSIVGRSPRSDEAEAEIEAHDIDEMLDARAERRAASGRESIGNELAEQAREPRG